MLAVRLSSIRLDWFKVALCSRFDLIPIARIVSPLLPALRSCAGILPEASGSLLYRFIEVVPFHCVQLLSLKKIDP